MHMWMRACRNGWMWFLPVMVGIALCGSRVSGRFTSVFFFFCLLSLSPDSEIPQPLKRVSRECFSFVSSHRSFFLLRCVFC